MIYCMCVQCTNHFHRACTVLYSRAVMFSFLLCWYCSFPAPQPMWLACQAMLCIWGAVPGWIMTFWLALGFAFRASSIRVTIRITNRCDFLYYVFISFFSCFPYMFRALMSPSSGVLQAVVFMLPFGSCSALLIVCVRQRTGLWWWLRCTHHHKQVLWRTQTINKALHEPNGSIKTTACNTPDDGLMRARNM